jgi:cobalamin biosynthesis Mg chelatase CobN
MQHLLTVKEQDDFLGATPAAQAEIVAEIVMAATEKNPWKPPTRVARAVRRAVFALVTEVGLPICSNNGGLFLATEVQQVMRKYFCLLRHALSELQHANALKHSDAIQAMIGQLSLALKAAAPRKRKCDES